MLSSYSIYNCVKKQVYDIQHTLGKGENKCTRWGREKTFSLNRACEREPPHHQSKLNKTTDRQFCIIIG